MPTSKNPSASDDDTKQPDENATSNDSQQNMYIEDLIKSGKAAVAKDGKLPPGATHEIVGTDADGRPIVVRRRFS